MSPRKALRNTPGIVFTGDKGTMLGALSRDCPKCHAPAGRKCARLTGGKVAGEDIGGGYEVPLKMPHRERRKWTPPEVLDPEEEAAAEAALYLPHVNMTAEGMSAVGILADALETTRDDAINRAVIYYCRYVIGLVP